MMIVLETCVSQYILSFIMYFGTLMIYAQEYWNFRPYKGLVNGLVSIFFVTQCSSLMSLIAIGSLIKT